MHTSKAILSVCEEIVAFNMIMDCSGYDVFKNVARYIGDSQGVVGLNLVLSDTVFFSLLILVAWGMVNQNQDDAP